MFDGIAAVGGASNVLCLVSSCSGMDEILETFSGKTKSKLSVELIDVLMKSLWRSIESILLIDELSSIYCFTSMSSGLSKLLDIECRSVAVAMLT